MESLRPRCFLPIRLRVSQADTQIQFASRRSRWLDSSPRGPDGDLAGAKGAVAEVGGGRGTDARLGRGVGPLAAADAFDPVGQVEQLAVGLVVEVRALAARVGRQDPLL